MADMGQGATGNIPEQFTGTVGCGMMHQPPLWLLLQRDYQQRPESWERKELGVCSQGRDSLVLFSQGKGREGSSLGWDTADKALGEREALTEVRNRALGEDWVRQAVE